MLQNVDALFMDCHEMLQNVTECSCLIYGVQQNVTEYRCLIHNLLRNAEAETTECYEMVYKLIKAPSFRNILLNSIHKISTFRYFTVMSITGQKVATEVI